VAYEAALRGRAPLDQGGRGEYLLALAQARLLVYVDDFEFVTALQEFFTQGAHGRDGTRGSGRHSGDIEAQFEGLQFARIAQGVREGIIHLLGRRGRRSSPTSTRSVFERSPIIFLIGVGRCRTRVGSARIWSPRPSCGFSTRSMTSMLYRPSRYSSQILRRLANARTAFGVLPAT